MPTNRDRNWPRAMELELESRSARVQKSHAIEPATCAMLAQAASHAIAFSQPSTPAIAPECLQPRNRASAGSATLPDGGQVRRSRSTAWFVAPGLPVGLTNKGKDRSAVATTN